MAATLEIDWLSEYSALTVGSPEVSKLEISGHHLVRRGWTDGDASAVECPDIFGPGPARALVLRRSDEPNRAVVVGEEGSSLYELDLTNGECRRMAEMPRFPNDVGGMCRLDVLETGKVTLLHWELGVLALGPSLQCVWRQDLEWNHSLVGINETEVWFDLMYESMDVPQRIGEHPWGFLLEDGRQILDRGGPGDTSPP